MGGPNFGLPDLEERFSRPFKRLEEFDEFGLGEWLELCEVPAFLGMEASLR